MERFPPNIFVIDISECYNLEWGVGLAKLEYSEPGYWILVLATALGNSFCSILLNQTSLFSILKDHSNNIC